MTSHARAIAAAIALSTCTFSALATATADASFSDFKVTLRKLDAAGPDPSASFIAFGGTTVFASLSSTGDNMTISDSQNGGSAFGPASASESNGNSQSAFAFLAGDVQGAGGAMAEAGAHTTGDAAGLRRDASSGVLLGEGGPYMSFTLGANTVLEVSAIATVSTTLAPPAAGELEFADAVANLRLYDTDSSDTQAPTFNLESDEYDYDGDLNGSNGSQSAAADLLFYGSATGDTNGVFVGSLQTSAWSAIPVPEPTNVAMLLAGLGALVLRRRRAA